MIGIHALEQEQCVVGLEATTKEGDSRITTLNAGLNWTVRPPRPHRPGMTLWLKGAQQDIEDRNDASNSADSHQVFLGLSINYGR